MMEKLTVTRMAGIGVSLAAGLMLLRLRGRAKPQPGQPPDRKLKRRRLWLLAGGVFGLWLCCGLVLGIFAAPSEGLHVAMMAPRMDILGFSVSSSVFVSWCAMLLVIIPAVAIRVFVIPKFKEKPGGAQAVLETMVDYISGYSREKSGVESPALNAYMLTLALFLVSCAVVELFSFRPPTADIVTTLSLALCTFVMINYYGVRKKGVGGRIGSFAKPIPIVFPFRVLSDIAIPVSLACRLFGNMLGGMIVMHLVYMALGAFGVGIPAVLGLYFNVFHPIIQVFIFITLSLTFIGEAVE